MWQNRGSATSHYDLCRLEAESRNDEEDGSLEIVRVSFWKKELRGTRPWSDSRLQGRMALVLGALIVPLESARI